MKSNQMGEAQRFFLTSVSLITSDGPYGQNVMAAEWTMQISYRPMLIAVFIHEGSATLYNIKMKKKFAINLASEDQSALVSVAGGYSRREVDKLRLTGLFNTRTGRFGLPLIRDCVVAAECKLFSIEKFGDHTMVVGKVLSIEYNPEKKPLIYHQRRYFKVGRKIEPRRKEVKVGKKIFDVFNSGNKEFVAKYAGFRVISKGMVLVSQNDTHATNCFIPYVRTTKHHDNKKELESHLKRLQLKIQLYDEPEIKRLMLKYNGRCLRTNFILFGGKLGDTPKNYQWKPFARDAFLKSLIK
ncbi:MAG: flavin reductase [Thaumarchaeota archaeon]|nr:flavin reductase [Nitrososphaerota archaeon]